VNNNLPIEIKEFMTNANDGPDHDARFDQANAWYFRLNASDVSETEKAAFEAWLGDCPANREAWDEATSLALMLRAPARRVHDSMQRTAQVRSGRPRRRAGRGFLAGAAALSLLIIGIVQGPLLYQNAIADYRTGVGQTQTVALSDGSRIELNTNSAISIDLSGNRRQVTLLRGEAYFVVGHADARPFVVGAADRDIHDIGTAFNVDLSTSWNVTVAEGIVEIRPHGAEQEGTRVDAGQSLAIVDGSEKLRDVADVPASLAWRNGQLIFTSRPLGEVMAELNRYYRGQFVIANPAVRDMVVSGVLDIGTRQDLPEVLSTIFHVRSVSISRYLLVMY
jgi:transmembrane sensor